MMIDELCCCWCRPQSPTLLTPPSYTTSVKSTNEFVCRYLLLTPAGACVQERVGGQSQQVDIIAYITVYKIDAMVSAAAEVIKRARRTRAYEYGHNINALVSILNKCWTPTAISIFSPCNITFTFETTENNLSLAFYTTDVQHPPPYSLPMCASRPER